MKEQEQLITLDTYKLAKEKGFNETSIPSQSILQRWLRNSHDIHIELYRMSGHFKLRVVMAYEEGFYENGNPVIRHKYSKQKLFDEYEDGLEDGLETALKMI